MSEWSRPISEQVANLVHMKVGPTGFVKVKHASRGIFLLTAASLLLTGSEF
jgi:hypothetical protein